MHHTKIVRLFFLLICFLPGLALAAAPQTIHVEWGYTPPASPAVTGFKLYQEDTVVCQVKDPSATAMDCSVSLAKETTDFTLTATFDDGTESPRSTPFPFTVPDNPDTQNPPGGQGTGDKLFTFTWTAPADATGLKGYRIYLNNSLLCETTSPSATTLACKTDLLQEVMTFSMTKVTASGSESSPSNLLVFDPTAYPELFTNTKQLTFSWEYNQTTNIKGFRIYQNSTLICQSNDPAARQLTCTADLVTTPTTYTLTAVNADSTETSFSNTLTYTGNTSTGTGDAELKAMIATNIASGPAPLSVTFDGTASTGSVTSYQWDFGDGSIATTSTASHTYATAGTYTAKLTVGNSAGVTNTTTVAITASNPVVVAPTPPKAVISSSAAAGPAPLTVSFDGSGSTATNATIASYAWSFGDGASGIGAIVSHVYASAGTYNAALTVTDSKGQTSQVNTPIIVTAPVVNNKPPQAVISATPTAGPAPLTVTFNGGGSTDSDGSITNYVWNFGDGGTATGKSVTHTYTTAATFTANLQVTDDKGATGTTSVTITAKTELPTQPTTDVKLETGEIAVSSNWVRVPLTTSFTNPIVVAGPPSFNNADPCTVRIRNVDKTGFDIKVTEWDYLDGIHPQETVSYLVMEQGHYTLPDGTVVEAGSFTGATSFKTMAFKSAFTKIPVVLTTVTTMNDAKTVSGRLKSIATSGFAYSYQEQEKNTNKHLDETVHYIAWEPSAGMIGTLQYAVVKTANSVTDAWYSEKYKSAFKEAPLLLADMQTTNDTGTAALRMQNQTAAGFQVKAEAEMSKNSKTKHSAETVGYVTLDQVQEKVMATFSWTFDTNQEGSINGFQILANGEVVCTSDHPSARQLSCEMAMQAGQTTFTIQAINATGGISSPSNSITYTP